MPKAIEGVAHATLKQLRRTTPPESIEWRIGASGKKKDGNIWAMGLAYMDNRYVQETLDEIIGPGYWHNEFQPWRGDTASLCGISINVEGQWITKWDGAPDTDFEAIKGGLSDSQKRAAVQWGIGRDLYEMETVFVETSLTKVDGWRKAAYTNQRTKEITDYWWKVPSGTAPVEPPQEEQTPEDKYKDKVVAAVQESVDNKRAPKDDVGQFAKESVVPDGVRNEIIKDVREIVADLAELRGVDRQAVYMEFLPFKGGKDPCATDEMVGRFKKGKAINWLVNAAQEMHRVFDIESDPSFKKLADDDDLPF